jgi:acyl-homoserine lactone acylase PvdQ
MKRQKVDKIGLQANSKIHDTKTRTLQIEEKHNFIKKIICYTSEDGIHGFFPFYKDDYLNKEIFADSFYNDFKNTHLEKLTNKLISHKQNLSVITLEFSDMEVINSIQCKCEEENNNKITAIKIKTTKDIYIIGDSLKLNKQLPKLNKDDNFIPGLKLGFSQENQLIYLTSIQPYFEKDDNFHKYVSYKQQNSYIDFALKTYFNIEALFINIFKVLFFLTLILGIILFTIKSTHEFSGGDIIVDEPNLLNSKIHIHTDQHGFPHINASNIEDSYFAIGFLHAKERLWQLEFLRRISRGKLSEIFGKKTLEIDRFVKSIGLNYISEKNAEKFIYNNNEEAKKFQKYVDGINYYVSYYPLPIEFKMMFHNDFKYWEITDSVAIFNFVSFTLSYDWEAELWHKYIEDNLGVEFVEILMSFSEMNHPFSNESVVNDEELVELNMHKNRKTSDEAIKLEREKAEKKAKIHMEKNQNEIKNKTVSITASDDINNNIINNLASDGASNSWVISGKHTVSGKPILANDPHLQNNLPSNLFVIKTYLPDNILSGVTYPGFPFLIIGSNKDISWGITTENGDLIDICEEKIEDDYYLFDGKKYKIVETEETIEIKGERPEKINVRWTRNGPLINKIVKQFHSINRDLDFDIPLSIKIYSYLYEFTSFSYYFKANYASDPNSLLEYSEKFMSANFHIVWATKTDIGYYPLGKFHVKNYGKRFCKGYNSKDQVTKTLKKNELPILRNPKKGFIVTANNRMVNFNYTYNIKGYHNHVRAFRIREMIEEKLRNLEKFDLKENIKILQNQKDSLASIILPQLLQIYERNNKNKEKNLNKNINLYLDKLKNWDFVLDKNSIEATIYSVLEYNIGKQLLGKKISEESARSQLNMLSYWNFISGIINKIYQNEEIELNQCAYIGGSKNCEKYLVDIFNNLDEYLTEYKDFNGNIKKWGDVLFHHFEHITFNNIPLVNLIFSRKVSTGGNRNTINYARIDYSRTNGNFVSRHSANFKIICDMANPTEPFVILNTGNSGNALSNFYDNFIKRNIEGDLIKFKNINFNDYQKADKNTLVFIPNTSTKANDSIRNNDDLNNIINLQ